MIRITRRRAKPTKLQRDAAAETRALTDAFDADPAAYRSGAKSFASDETVKIKSSIYGHKSVKDALIEDQHGKCAFCESAITATQYGDVEHFRPKRGYVQDLGDAMGRPGYYWLAYDWSNLFLACQLCNQRHKRTLFPLENPAARASDHHADLSHEIPVFLKPDIENPADCLRFNGEIAVGRDRDGRGRRTLEALRLNRRELVELRRETYNFCRTIHRLLEVGEVPADKEAEARAVLARAQEDRAPYAGMIRAAVAAGFP